MTINEKYLTAQVIASLEPVYNKTLAKIFSTAQSEANFIKDKEWVRHPRIILELYKKEGKAVEIESIKALEN